MGFSLITGYPAWFILFCLAAGFLYSWVLYRKHSLFTEVSGTVAWIMAASRFILVSILCFLLLGPMIRTLTRELEKPIVVLALDASSSIMQHADSSELRQQYRQVLTQLESDLKGAYELSTFSFGETVRENLDFNFKDQQTDFTSLYDQLDIRYANRNIGAVIIATDGIYNAGENPVYGPARLKVPVYTIALGDTSFRKDLILSKVNHNRTAFLGNAFPLEITVDARQCNGANATLTVKDDSAVVFTRNIQVSGNKYHTVVPLMLTASKKGIRQYKISITSLEGEVTYANNSRDVFIEVIENKQKVLILANAPNPDITAIRSSIESSPNYEVDFFTLSDFTGRAGDYSVAILHNLPSANPTWEVVRKKLTEASLPVWYILGASSNIPLFNNLNSGVTVNGMNGKLSEVQAIPVRGFTLFTLSDELLQQSALWPPLYSNFGVYNQTGNINTLFTQRIGTVSTEQPLFYLTAIENVKTAVLCGEGIWRWKLADYSSNGNHNLSNELISGIIQYLNVRENRSPFRVRVKNNFRENEPLVFDAELFNESGQLINQPEARLILFDNRGKQFPFTFSRTENAYTLSAGNFPVGNYKYRAEVKSGNTLLRQEGEFSVQALQLESSSTVADHAMLSTLSSRTGGEIFFPSQVNQIPESLKKREDLTTVSFMHKKLEELVSLPWVFVLLFTLLSLEWFLRKRSGSY